MSGTLTLVATPISDDLMLDVHALELIKSSLNQENTLILQEEPKVARRRWLYWGLPRDWIDKFQYYNEHNQFDTIEDILRVLKSGVNVFLLSDCGLPCLSDPGQELVDRCHENNINVSCTPFENSMLCALILSGFPNKTFIFHGFLPKEKEQRAKFWKLVSKEKRTQIIMDTPYRLTKCREEAARFLGERAVFWALDINKPEQFLKRTTGKNSLIAFEGAKKEFILIVSEI